MIRRVRVDLGDPLLGVDDLRTPHELCDRFLDTFRLPPELLAEDAPELGEEGPGCEERDPLCERQSVDDAEHLAEELALVAPLRPRQAART